MKRLLMLVLVVPALVGTMFAPAAVAGGEDCLPPLYKPCLALP